jgi:hypothetical protein
MEVDKGELKRGRVVKRGKMKEEKGNMKLDENRVDIVFVGEQKGR